MHRSPLFLLRNRTGLAYNLCREALNKHNNNVEEAEAWLKAQAITHGYQKATKVRGRSTREGLICLAIQEDYRLATLVELNCETDFVARNQIFKDFAIDLTLDIASTSSDGEIYPLNNLKQIEGVKVTEKKIKKFDDKIVPLISKLSENIKLAKALHIRVSEAHSDVKLFGQIHAKTISKSLDKFAISGGRFGAIVGLESQKVTQSGELVALNQIGSRLCQHVIGYSPQYIELPDSIKKNLIENERKQLEAPEKRAVDVDVQDYSDGEDSIIPSGNIRDDWPSMMDQTLIMSEDVAVRDYCSQNGVSVIYFERFECGVES